MALKIMRASSTVASSGSGRTQTQKSAGVNGWLPGFLLPRAFISAEAMSAMSPSSRLIGLIVPCSRWYGIQ